MLQPAPVTDRAPAVRPADVRPLDPIEHLSGASRPPRGNLPVHPILAPAFPGGLRRGGIYHLTGSLTIALGLIAGASDAGGWAGVVGIPDLGIEAAADWGIDLDRLILLPTGGKDWTQVIAALIEAVDLVIAPTPPRLAPAELNRLTARLRDRRATVVVLGRWPAGSLAHVHAHTERWDGIGDGRGYLTRRHLRLDITERHRTRSVHLELS